YPNPVNDILYISVANKGPRDYLVEIRNLRGQKIMSKRFDNIQNAIIEYPRIPGIVPGVYSISVTDLLNYEKETYKIIYK
ncbi:MAG TPA: T9SS type A sorting domain-containing protein, partial [Ignavibacteriaceae bacterium]